MAFESGLALQLIEASIQAQEAREVHLPLHSQFPMRRP